MGIVCDFPAVHWILFEGKSRQIPCFRNNSGKSRSILIMPYIMAYVGIVGDYGPNSDSSYRGHGVPSAHLLLLYYFFVSHFAKGCSTKEKKQTKGSCTEKKVD